jgi:hypothetical protein
LFFNQLTGNYNKVCLYSPNILLFFFNLFHTAAVSKISKTISIMAKASFEVINIIRNTAIEISRSNNYQWGHMGACNCGFLAQQVTKLSKGEIHRRAMQGHGDWNEQLNDYCPTSGVLFDDVITALLSAGFDIDDLRHLETLGDKDVRAHIFGKSISCNNRTDVILYLYTWADLLEEELLENISLPPMEARTLKEFARE